ncbi:MAG: hypothetical protein AB7N61_24030 [Acidimicrobiia bacterium]
MAASTVIVDAAWYEDGKRVMVATSINELALYLRLKASNWL